MSDNQPYISQESILENPYEKEVQEDIWQHERKKTIISIIAIGIVLLIVHLIAYSSADALDSDHLFDILLFPLCFFGLGLFARLQPLVSVIGSIVVILIITGLGVMEHGAVFLIAGWLYKVIGLFFLVKAFQHAREAEQARKKLQALS